MSCVQSQSEGFAQGETSAAGSHRNPLDLKLSLGFMLQ